MYFHIHSCVCVYVWNTQQAAVDGSCCESLACSATAKVFHYNWLTHTAGEMEIKRDTEVNQMIQLKKHKKQCYVMAAAPPLQFLPGDVCTHSAAVGDDQTWFVSIQTNSFIMTNCFDISVSWSSYGQSSRNKNRSLPEEIIPHIWFINFKTQYVFHYQVWLKNCEKANA